MKIKKISLRSLNDNVMSDIELGHLLGGNECGCGCNGSSSHSSNMSANYANSYLPGSSCNYTSYDGENMGLVCRNHA